VVFCQREFACKFELLVNSLIPNQSDEMLLKRFFKDSRVIIVEVVLVRSFNGEVEFLLHRSGLVLPPVREEPPLICGVSFTYRFIRLRRAWRQKCLPL
jgi:hypothetical protein